MCICTICDELEAVVQFRGESLCQDCLEDVGANVFRDEE